MKPKGMFANSSPEGGSCYDREPRTGKAFNSIKINDSVPKANSSLSQKVDSQSPYTNWRREFTQDPFKVERSKRVADPNENELEHHMDPIGKGGQNNNPDTEFAFISTPKK